MSSTRVHLQYAFERYFLSAQQVISFLSISDFYSWNFKHRPGRVSDSSGGGASSSVLADCAR